MLRTLPAEIQVHDMLRLSREVFTGPVFIFTAPYLYSFAKSAVQVSEKVDRHTTSRLDYKLSPVSNIIARSCISVKHVSGIVLFYCG